MNRRLNNAWNAKRCLGTLVMFFFSDDVLQRNRYIKRGALVEASPILLLLRCLEASEWQFLRLVDKQWNLGA